MLKKLFSPFQSSEYKSVKNQIKNFSQELKGLGSKELSPSERKRFHDRYKRFIDSTRRIDFNRKDYMKVCETISEFRKKFQHLGFIDDDIPSFNMSDTHSETRRYNLRSSTREQKSSTSEQKKYKSGYYVAVETEMESIMTSLQNSNMKLISLDNLNTYKKRFNAIGKDVSERRDISKEECEELSRLYHKYVTQFRKLTEEIESKIEGSDMRNEHVTRSSYPKSAETQTDNNIRLQTILSGCWRSPKYDEDSESKKSNTHVVTNEPKISSENEREEIKKHQNRTIDLPHAHSFVTEKDEWNMSKGNIKPSKESSTIDWAELETSNYLPLCEKNPYSKSEEEPSDITNSGSCEGKANKHQTKPQTQVLQSFYNMGIPFKGKEDLENEVEAEEKLQRCRENANLNRKEIRETAAIRIQRSVADELLKKDQQSYLYQLGKNYRVHKNEENVEDMNQPSHLNYSQYDRTYLESSRWKIADERNRDCKPSKPSQDYGCALVLNPLQTTRMAAFQSHSKYETEFSKDHINVDRGVIHEQPTAPKSQEGNVSQAYGKHGNKLSKDYSNIQSCSANYTHSKDRGDSTKDNSNAEAEFNMSRHNVQNSNQRDQRHDQHRYEVRGRGKFYRQSFEEQNEVLEENLRRYHQHNDYRNYNQYNRNSERYESHRPRDCKHYTYNNYETSSQIQSRKSLPDENYNDQTTRYTNHVQEAQEVKTEEPLQILDVHKYFRDDFDLNSLDSLDVMDRIDSIETYARTFEKKVNTFDEEKDSLEYFLLDEKLLRLIEKLDKIKCREDQATTHRKVEVIRYIKNLCTVLDQRAKDE